MSGRDMQNDEAQMTNTERIGLVVVVAVFVGLVELMYALVFGRGPL